VPNRRILLIEDEASIAEPLAAALRREGFEVETAATAARGRERFNDASPDLVLLDVMLPDGDGRDLLREFRARSSRVPIVMLTARGEEMDRIVGLELGADDYVTKPFSAAELVARLRAVLRRATPPSVAHEAGAILEVGEVRMDLEKRAVTLRGEPVALTLKEFDLLRVLLENAGRLVTRQKLIADVWQENWYGPTKTLDVHVSGLRKKLGDDAAEPRYVRTIRGVGFRFSSPEELAG
jgi:two-component system, OmpR family, response regulator RegX3